MKDESPVEAEVRIETSKDGKTVTIIIDQTTEQTFVDLLENIDFIYKELKRAYDQKSKPGVKTH